MESHNVMEVFLRLAGWRTLCGGNIWFLPRSGRYIPTDGYEILTAQGWNGESMFVIEDAFAKATK